MDDVWMKRCTVGARSTLRSTFLTPSIDASAMAASAPTTTVAAVWTTASAPAKASSKDPSTDKSPPSINVTRSPPGSASRCAALAGFASQPRTAARTLWPRASSSATT